MFPSNTSLSPGEFVPWPVDQDPTTPTGKAQWDVAIAINDVAARKLATAGSSAIATAETALATANTSAAVAQKSQADALAALVQVEQARLAWEQAPTPAPVPQPVPSPTPVPTPAPGASWPALQALVTQLTAALQAWTAQHPSA